MTRRLYLDDAYLRACDATVVRAEGATVVLDQTVLYAESGGQAADHGRLTWEGGERRVVDSQVAGNPAEPAASADSDAPARRRGHVGDVTHTLDGPAPPQGTRVRVEVDWERRHGLMRHHTAAHVIAAVVYRDFGAKFTGGQLYPDRARLDVHFDAWEPAMLKRLEDAVNAEVAKGYSVRNYDISHEEFAKGDLLRTAENLLDPRLVRVRITDIVDSAVPPGHGLALPAGGHRLDAQADGGTHVRDTREVGRVTMEKADNKGKGHRRISYRCVP